MDRKEGKTIEELISENRALKVRLLELQEKLDALKRTASPESATRMFKLVKEKMDLLEKTNDELEMLRERNKTLTRKLAEMEDKLERIQHFLSIFRQILNAFPGALLCVDVSGNIIYANDAANSGLFASYAPLVGRNLESVELPEADFSLRASLSEMFKGGAQRLEKDVSAAGVSYRLVVAPLRGKGSLLGAFIYVERRKS